MPWQRPRKWKQKRIARIAERDGTRCWLCNRMLRLDGVPPNSRRAATLEHLVAVTLGGSHALDNLVLCHPPCNRHLGDRPLEQKRAIREKWHREVAAVARSRPRG